MVLLGAALFAVFFALGRGDIFEDNEGQRAAPPATMVRTGDYVIPRLNGEPYLVKPPLLYWAIAGVYRAAGISEFTARTPTALAGVALVMSMYFLSRKQAGERAARWAALAMLASPYALQRMRYSELDIPLTLAIFLAIVAARNATLNESAVRRAQLCIASGIAFGAAVMLKGPVPFLFFWAAAIAVFVTSSPNLTKVAGVGIRVSIAAFALELLLKEIAVRVLPAHAKALGTPVALIAVMLVWTYLALRHAGIRRARLGYWFGAMAIGASLALPWGVAVIRQMSWETIRAMLHSQVVERTYVASEINSGAPWYFIAAIAFMIAPWGFLLPFQFSKREWDRQNDLYRFCVLMSWLSVLLFSLIAGKEYEYILPCVPFMVIALGYHIAQIGSGLAADWMERWARYWQIATLALLAVALPGGIAYFAVRGPSFTLFALTAPLAVVGLLACLISFRSRTYRNAGIFAATLCAVLVYLIGRGDHYRGNESPKGIAVLAARFANAGYTVEQSKMYPSVDFYSATVIPLEQSPARVKEKFASKEPYIYLTRESLLQLAGLKEYHVLAGPIGFKDLMLISNQMMGPPGEM